jgi:nitrogen fixation NifU-like protein
MDLYAENILDHYKHPRNAGLLHAPTVQHREENVSCGDDMTVELLIQNDVITDFKWQAKLGCHFCQRS